MTDAACTKSRHRRGQRGKYWRHRQSKPCPCHRAAHPAGCCAGRPRRQLHRRPPRLGCRRVGGSRHRPGRSGARPAPRRTRRNHDRADGRQRRRAGAIRGRARTRQLTALIGRTPRAVHQWRSCITHNQWGMVRPSRPVRRQHGRWPYLQTRRSDLTHAYPGGYASINSQQVIDSRCRTFTICCSGRSPIRPVGQSSNGCAATEN